MPRRISLFSRCCGLLDQTWRQWGCGKQVKGHDIGLGRRASLRRPEPVVKLLEDPVELGVDRGGVGVGEDRAHDRGHERAGRLGTFVSRLCRKVEEQLEEVYAPIGRLVFEPVPAATTDVGQWIDRSRGRMVARPRGSGMPEPATVDEPPSPSLTVFLWSFRQTL